MRPKSATRCYWFEDDGTPIGKTGCPNGNRCDFAHPSDEQWDLLPKQRSRPLGYSSSSNRDGYYRGDEPVSPIRKRRSGYRSSTRSRSRSRSRSRHRHGRSRERKERMDVSRSPVRTRTMDRSSIASSSSNAPPTSPLPTTTTTTAATSTTTTSTTPMMVLPKFTKPIPTGPSAFRIASSSKKPLLDVITSPQLARPDDSVPGLHSLKSPLTSLTPSAQVVPPPLPAGPSPPSQPPPPPPPSGTMLPPPYPLPEVPECLTVKIPPPVEPPSPAEKRKIWEERVKLFADAYQVKQDLERCEQQYKQATDISQSSYFSAFSEDDKTRYNTDLAELLVNRDNLKKAHDDAVERLIDQGSWPLGPPPPTTKADEEEEEERRDIRRHVQELNDTAQRMAKILGDIAMKTKPPVLPVPASGDEDEDEDDIYADDTMDVDTNAAAGTPSGSLPSRKRQRLSEGGHEPRPEIDPDLPTREELEVYRTRLEKLEGKITDLDNELVQYEGDAKRSFRHDLESKIEEHNAEWKQKDKERREREKKARDEELSKVNAEAEDLENDVNEMGKEVAEVISKIESLKIQLVEEKKHRDIMQANVAEVNERLQGYVQQRESNVRTMQTLEAALKAYLSSLSQPSPPATPSTVQTVAPTSDYILSELQEPILQAIREHLQPMLAQSRIDTETLVKERHTEIVRKIWPRMEMVSILLEKLADRLDQEVLMTPVAPLAPAPAPAPPAPPPETVQPVPMQSVPMQPVPTHPVPMHPEPMPTQPGPVQPVPTVNTPPVIHQHHSPLAKIPYQSPVLYQPT